MSYHLRWMIRRDMPEVLEIEQFCFDSPWTEDDFLRCLRQRNCICMIAEYGDDQLGVGALGFMVYELHKSRLELLKLAVHPSVWRRGIGTAILDKLKSKTSHDRRRSLSVVARESNLPCHLFLRSQGFRATRILRGYYEDNDEDAYSFRWAVTDAVQEVAV